MYASKCPRESILCNPVRCCWTKQGPMMLKNGLNNLQKDKSPHPHLFPQSISRVCVFTRWGNNKHLLRQLPRRDCWSSSHLFTHLISLKVDCVHHVTNPYNTRGDNIQLLLHHLSRSDYWSNRHFFTQLILLKADCRDRFNNLYYRRWGNKKFSLRQLPRSGCLSSSYLLPISILFKVYCVHRINNLYNTRWGNKMFSLRQLPRSGWSFGRAGLGAKATYPA